MLQRVNSYVTWGEPTKETVIMMLQKRGRLAGDKKLTDEYLQKAGYKSIDDLAEAIVACKVAFQKLPDIEAAIQAASAKQRLQRQNQEGLQSRRRSRLPRRSNKRTSKTHGLTCEVCIFFQFYLFLRAAHFKGSVLNPLALFVFLETAYLFVMDGFSTGFPGLSAFMANKLKDEGLTN